MNTDGARIDTDQSMFIRAKSMFIRGRFCPGLRYNKNAITPGAQTERRSDAGPVRDFACRLGPHRPLLKSEIRNLYFSAFSAFSASLSAFF
jgi:hypothetical protein